MFVILMMLLRSSRCVFTIDAARFKHHFHSTSVEEFHVQR
jgi:hypothetical protein